MQLKDLSPKNGTRQGIRVLLEVARRFPTQFHSWEAVILEVMTYDSYEWHGGNIRFYSRNNVQRRKTEWPYRTTERGMVDLLTMGKFDYIVRDFENKFYPIPIQHIPDNISPFWFKMIEDLISTIERLHPPHFYNMLYWKYKALGRYIDFACKGWSENQISKLKQMKKQIGGIKKRLNEIKLKRGDGFQDQVFDVWDEFHNFCFLKK